MQVGFWWVNWSSSLGLPQSEEDEELESGREIIVEQSSYALPCISLAFNLRGIYFWGVGGIWYKNISEMFG